MGMQVPVERERIGVGCCEFVLGAQSGACNPHAATHDLADLATVL